MIYKLAFDKVVADELRKRFAPEIAWIESEGFRSFSLHQEIIYPFSVLIFFPIYLAMRMGGEIVQIQSPLRITTFHLLYSSQTHATYAYVYGLGCKFYTHFTDGTWLVSNTSQKINNPKVIILKSEPGRDSNAQIWKRHQEKTSDLVAEGRQVNPRVTFDAWAGLERQFGQGSLSSVILTGIVWVLLVAWALYWLIGKLMALAGAG